MDSGTSTPSGLLNLLGWLEVNKKRVLIGGAIAGVVVIGAAAVIYNENQKEVRASEALSEIRAPISPATPPPPATTEALLNIASEHPGTKAAARALVQAAGIVFLEGNYTEAQALFAREEKEYPESPWLPQALLGVAASLEAQQKTTEALAEYEKLRKRYPTDAIADDVKLALARLYERQNRAEEAFALYQEVLRGNQYNSIGAEAGMRQEDLLQRFPYLVKTNAPPVAPTASVTPATATNLQARAGTNRVQTIALSNLMNRPRTNVPAVTATNRPGTNQPLLIRPTSPPANATPANPQPAPKPSPPPPAPK